MRGLNAQACVIDLFSRATTHFGIFGEISFGDDRGKEG